MQNTKRIAFLMPIIPRHFTYARNFLASFEYHKLNKQADFYFIFSNKEEEKACNTKYGAIVLPDNLKDLGIEQGIINVKKFYGIYEIKDKYDYIIVLDAESLIIKNIDLLDVCETYFRNKILWGAPQYTVEAVLTASKEFFKEKEKIDDLGLYLWFNNLCIYKTSTIENFFEKTNLKENLTKLTVWHFDYYIYMFYLYLYHDFRPRNFINTRIGCPHRGCTINVDFMTKFMHIASPEKYKEVKRLVGGGTAYSC